MTFAERQEFRHDWYSRLDRHMARRYKLMGFNPQMVEILTSIAMEVATEAYQTGIAHERHMRANTKTGRV